MGTAFYCRVASVLRTLVTLAVVATAPAARGQDAEYPWFQEIGCDATGALVRLNALGGPNPPESACFWGPLSPSYRDGDGPMLTRLPDPGGTDQPAGFRLNVNLVDVHIPGDFIHPSPMLAGTSLPLIPPGMDHEPTSWSGLTRPTVAGAADLITGAPLVRVVDLELPFDGATFRLSRTRSQIGFFQRAARTRSVDADRWWDFTGAGWMIGENPLLLVDAALPDVVGNNPRACWLVLDAFQSIPFQQIESTGMYEAPARFRARMHHNGVWVNRSWSTPPTRYTVSLYDGALTYSFTVHREDVPTHEWDLSTLGTVPGPHWLTSSLHARPFLPQQFPDGRLHSPWSSSANPGFGVPYYATCDSIEDRYGHVVEMTYQPAEWFVLDHSGTPECLECAQGCPSKGQLRSLRLGTRRADGTLDVLWTLVYAHRLVAPVAAPTHHPAAAEWNNALASAGVYGVGAIDRIYVYEGDVTPSLAGSEFTFTIPPTDRMILSDGTLSLDAGADPLERVPLQHPLQGWRHCIRYHYDYTRESSQPAKLGRVTCPPTLLKTTLSRRESVTSEVTASTRAYVYTGLAPNELSGAPLPWLEAVFEPQDAARLLASAGEDACAQSDGVQPLLAELDGHAFTLNDLVEQRWGAVAACEVRDDSGERVLIPAGARERLLSFATAQWRQTGAQDPMPADIGLVTLPDGHRHFIDANPSSIVHWGPAQIVRAVSVRAESARWRHMRIYKYWLPPASAPRTPRGGGRFAEFGSLGAPHRSVFVAPYCWQGYAQGEDGIALTSPPSDLTEARQIAVIDEFDSLAARDTPAYDSALGAPGLVSRRVITLNASGVTLKEREWRFDGASEATAAVGIGEESIYQTAAQYLNANADPGDDIPPAPPESSDVRPPTEDGSARPLVADSYASLRTELLLIEQRSLGWSVADLENLGAREGLVNFYEYRRHDTEIPPPPDSGEPVRIVHQVEQTASGIARGSPMLGSHARYYTQQIFSRESFAWNGAESELSVVVTFTAPRGNLLGACPLPGSSPDSWDGFVPTFSLTLRDSAQADVPPGERRILRTLTIGAPRRQRPAGTPEGDLWFYPIEGSSNDPQGLLRWACNGLVIDPLSPQVGNSALQSTTLTYYVRDDFGRTIHTVLDAAPGAHVTPHSAAGSSFTIGADCPWPRISDVDAHCYVTSFGYSGAGQLIDTFLPNRRRSATRTVVITHDEQGRLMPRERWFAREHIFSDLVESAADPRLCFTESPAQIRDYWGPRAEGAPKVTRTVDMTAAFNVNFYDESERPLRYRERAVVRAAPDANGRICAAELLEPDEAGNLFAVGSKEVNDLVDVAREREVDGSITRVTRNPLGQPLRTYTGTKDDGWATPTRPDGSLLPYNMILRSRVQYGTGINDIRLPVVTREYSSNPRWARDHHGQAPTPDPDGIATVTTYDWRGRSVRTDTYPRGEPSATTKRRSTQLTYLDFAGRPVLEATFGENGLTLPADLDPAQLGPEDATPSPSRLLTLPTRPLSLASIHYGPDGSEIERRAYDTGADAPSYIPTFTYAGRGGQGVFAHTAGGTAAISLLDGVGRVARAMVIAPGRGGSPYAYELSRTDYTYDADGNVITSTQWERVRENGDTLSTTNAIASRTHQWFDAQKRVAATLVLGSESGTTFAAVENGARWQRLAPPFDNPDVRPRIGCPTDAPESDPGALDAKLFDQCDAGGALELLNVATLPPRGRLTINRYNKAGQLTHSRSPEGLVTVQRYDRAGRMIAKIENAWGSAPLRRTTTYRYQLGRLIEIVAPSDAAGTRAAHTAITYGAAVVDDSFVEVSRSNAQVGRMYLPHPETGESRLSHHGATGATPDGFSTAPAVTLRYTFDGRIAERIDGRGLSFRYRYDDQARLSSVEVGHYRGVRALTVFAPGFPSWLAPAGIPAPRARVGYVEYSYSQRGELEDVRAYDSRARSQLLAHTRFAADVRGDPTAEWQALGGAVSSLTPAVRYAWERTPANAADPTDPAGARRRLASIAYPAPLAGAPSAGQGTVLSFFYGAEGSLDAQLGRVAAMRTRTEEVASFAHVGVSRRVALGWGRDASGAAQITDARAVSPGGAPAVAGLDEFGRTLRIAATNAAGVVLFGAEYGFDGAGNRSHARLTTSSATGQPVVNEESQLNHYDELNRLVATEHGAIQTSGGPPRIEPSEVVRSESWHMDLMGNWCGAGGGAGTTGPPGFERRGDLDSFGTAWAQLDADNARDVARVLHDIDRRNSIRTITAEEGNDGAPLSRETSVAVHDGAGNLVFDGHLVYIYDSWSRVVEVRRGSLNASVPAPDPGADSPPNAYARVNCGELIKRFAYDGLGRLVTTTTPLPPTATVTNRERVERFIYEGARRVQEYITETAISPAAQPARWLEREYVWGPGGGAGGVDELLAQFGGDGRAWWVIQDGGGDIVALAEAAGPQRPYARVAAQWTYDANGTVLSADHFAAHPPMHAGHKGLFVDRCDLGADGLAHDGLPARDGYGGFIPPGQEPPRLVPFSTSLYHVRNRTYAPHLGRWLQMDPNASGQTVLSAAAFNGRGFGALNTAFGLEERYADGMNLYGYLGGNSWGRWDAEGLFTFIGTVVTVSEINDVDAAHLDAVDESYGSMRDFARNTLQGFSAAQSELIDEAMDWSAFEQEYALSDWEQREEQRLERVRRMMEEAADSTTVWTTGAASAAPLTSGQINAVGGVSAQWRQAAAQVGKRGMVGHHLISWYKTQATRFNKLFDHYGISFDYQSLSNFAPIPKAQHRGRHRNSYHRAVYDFISIRLANAAREGRDVKEELYASLALLGEQVRMHPEDWFK